MATAIIRARSLSSRRGSFLRTRLGGVYMAFEVSRTTLAVRQSGAVVGAIVEVVSERGDEVLVRLSDTQRVWARRDEIVIADVNLTRSRRLLGLEVAS